MASRSPLGDTARRVISVSPGRREVGHRDPGRIASRVGHHQRAAAAGNQAPVGKPGVVLHAAREARQWTHVARLDVERHDVPRIRVRLAHERKLAGAGNAVHGAADVEHQRVQLRRAQVAQHQGVRVAQDEHGHVSRVGPRVVPDGSQRGERAAPPLLRRAERARAAAWSHVPRGSARWRRHRGPPRRSNSLSGAVIVWRDVAPEARSTR